MFKNIPIYIKMPLYLLALAALGAVVITLAVLGIAHLVDVRIIM